ncbi:MAG: putative transporter [Rikenellaceae bacterium]
MDFLYDLLFKTSVVQSILVIALTISLGLVFGRIKVKGVSLGIAWVLFVGLFLSHLGMVINPEVEHFVKEFGLILFVYSIGLQVGPGFFASLKKGGLSLNLMAASIILLGCITTYVLYLITGLDFEQMIGIYTGAITNTPALGAAQQTYRDITGDDGSFLTLGYAAAYPLGVIGIIFSMIAAKSIFSRFFGTKAVAAEKKGSGVVHIDVKVTNHGIEGRTVEDVSHLINRDFVISRIVNSASQIDIAKQSTVLRDGDILRIVTQIDCVDSIVATIGEQVYTFQDSDHSLESNLISRRIVVTRPEHNGKRICELNIRAVYGVNITRIYRAGIELLATGDLKLQLGDRVKVVGSEENVNKASEILGNSVKQLDHPNLFPIFIGIFLGIILGSIPFYVPGMPQAIKLGLAGGPLIVAILVSRFGPTYKLVTYTTNSANMMIREIGVLLFLASVSLGAGANFVETIVNGGYMWVLYGVIITILPLLIVSFVGIKFLKIDSETMMGLMAGSTTDPPALAYANSIASNDRASVAYATVYPLTMFLRVLSGQIMILIALS